MRYEVRVLRDGEREEGRFELERSEPPKVGEVFTQLTMIYKVRRVLADDEVFDAVAEVEQVGGPAQTGTANSRR